MLRIDVKTSSICWNVFGEKFVPQSSEQSTHIVLQTRGRQALEWNKLLILNVRLIIIVIVSGIIIKANIIINSRRGNG